MPSPIEILLDPVSLIILGMYALLIIWEALFPARELPKIAWWKTRSLSVFVCYFFLASYFPLLTDPFLAEYQLFNISRMGVVGGAIVAILIFEALLYFWHKAIHRNLTLWRIFHQMHHSAERVDTFGTFYFSIMDTIGFSLIASFSLVLIIGVQPQSITIFLLVTTFFSIFQHTNIKTPQWIGFIIQRPESHAIHHARKIHYKNFSDLPIFDIIFGTFENPKTREHQAGFYDGASARIGEMLMFKDVSKPPS